MGSERGMGCRQAKATLLQLLRFDPARRRPGEAGYGAGSGAPEVMFGYLKHMWYTGADRVDVLNRQCTSPPHAPFTCGCVGCNIRRVWDHMGGRGAAEG